MTSSEYPPGGFVTHASHDGRRLTLDPLIEGEVTAPVRRVESSITAGFRVQWGDGEMTLDDGTEVKFELTCGAGFGSPYMILHVQGHGEELTSVHDFLPAWVSGLVERERELARRVKLIHDPALHAHLAVSETEDHLHEHHNLKVADTRLPTYGAAVVFCERRGIDTTHMNVEDVRFFTMHQQEHDAEERDAAAAV